MYALHLRATVGEEDDMYFFYFVENNNIQLLFGSEMCYQLFKYLSIAIRIARPEINRL